MRLTIQLKLNPTKEQAATLKQTLERANAAANECSRVAWEHQTFGQFQVHQLSYHDLREQFGLSAQVVVRVIAKVADAYKDDENDSHKIRHKFFKWLRHIELAINTSSSEKFGSIHLATLFEIMAT